MSGFYLPESTVTTANPSPLHSPPLSKSTPFTKPARPNHNRNNLSTYSFRSPSPSSTSSGDELPYPAPLPRSDFLAPDFNPETYLGTLHNRHQTLEDLRSDLRSRSQLLSKELLDLVNANYEDFLGLGGQLKGGEERVEEVRLGVLGFRREVAGVRELVGEREQEVGRLLEERRGVRRDVLLGRRLLEVDERLSVLEEKLMVEPSASGQQREVDSEEEEEDEEDDDEDNDATPAARAAATALARLRSHAQQYLLLTHLTQKLQDHPFVVAQQSRILRVRNTLLLDLRTAMKQAQKAKVGGGQLLKFVVLYRELGEAEEAIKALKDV